MILSVVRSLVVVGLLTFAVADAQQAKKVVIRDSMLVSEASRISRMLGVHVAGERWEKTVGTLGVMYRTKNLSVGFSKATGEVATIHNRGLRERRMSVRPSQNDKFLSDKSWSQHGINQLRRIWPELSLELVRVRRRGEDSIHGRKWSSASNTVLIHWNEKSRQGTTRGFVAGFDRGTGQLLSVTRGPAKPSGTAHGVKAGTKDTVSGESKRS